MVLTRPESTITIGCPSMSFPSLFILLKVRPKPDISACSKTAERSACSASGSVKSDVQLNPCAVVEKTAARAAAMSGEDLLAVFNDSKTSLREIRVTEMTDAAKIAREHTTANTAPSATPWYRRIRHLRFE